MERYEVFFLRIPDFLLMYAIKHPPFPLKRSSSPHTWFQIALFYLKIKQKETFFFHLHKLRKTLYISGVLTPPTHAGPLRLKEQLALELKILFSAVVINGSAPANLLSRSKNVPQRIAGLETTYQPTWINSTTTTSLPFCLINSNTVLLSKNVITCQLLFHLSYSHACMVLLSFLFTAVH